MVEPSIRVPPLVEPPKKPARSNGYAQETDDDGMRDSHNTTQSVTLIGRSDVVIIVGFIALVVAILALYIATSNGNRADNAAFVAMTAERQSAVARNHADNLDVEVKTLRAALIQAGIKVVDEQPKN